MHTWISTARTPKYYSSCGLVSHDLLWWQSYHSIGIISRATPLCNTAPYLYAVDCLRTVRSVLSLVSKFNWLIMIMIMCNAKCVEQNFWLEWPYCSFCILWSYITCLHNNRDNIYNLRNSETDLALPLPKSEFGKRCFSYNGAVHWNNLPHNAKIAESVNSFKYALKHSMSWNWSIVVIII